MRPSPSTWRRVAGLLILVLGGACVNVDPTSGETLPRGNQRYKFDHVQENAERLQEGMTRMQVLFLLGSPAETRDGGDLWIWVPERPGLLVPTRSLQARFEGNALVEHGYHAIVLGKRF